MEDAAEALFSHSLSVERAAATVKKRNSRHICLLSHVSRDLVCRQFNTWRENTCKLFGHAAQRLHKAQMTKWSGIAWQLDHRRCLLAKYIRPQQLQLPEDTRSSLPPATLSQPPAARSQQPAAPASVPALSQPPAAPTLCPRQSRDAVRRCCTTRRLRKSLAHLRRRPQPMAATRQLLRSPAVVHSKCIVHKLSKSA